MNQHKPQSGKNFSSPKPIAGAIGRVLSGLGLKRRFDGWMAVQEWPQIVGEAIAEHAQAIRWDDGVLFVAVPDDTWRQQLSMQLEGILQKLHLQPYGRAVKKIRLEKGNKRNR